MSILYELRGAVAHVRLAGAEGMNALTREALSGLAEAFERVGHEPNVRAVILTGEGGRAFCAGTRAAEPALMYEEAALAGREVCDLIERCHVPVIAAVNGAAAGGGVELALACHIRLASEDARFSLPEVKLGLAPGYGGTERLARRAGNGRFLELMLAGEEISAEDALRAGLVNGVVAAGRLFTEAEELARKIAGLAPLAISACLEAVTRGLALPLEEGLELETELFAGLFSTEDVREGTRAFLEKRAPEFKGR